MATGTAPSLGMSFSRGTFAKLTPGPFLAAHLKREDAIRPNGRRLDEFRKLVINTGSLTHSNGSAVVRIGDTAIVCGVRGEILLASDIPQPSQEGAEEDALIEDLGLLVPNVELSTGCSPAHLPGNPPGTLAQSLSYRILSVLHTSQLISPKVLSITYEEPRTDDDLPDEVPTVTSKAYWTLYIDILCISLDGNAFDAAWIAVLAALRDTVLPKAWWDADREMIVCSPLVSEFHRLGVTGLPVASSFTVFSTASPLKQRAEAENWVLADPDALEEEVCRETLTVVVAPKMHGHGRLLRIEKSGGGVVGKELMSKCVRMAEERQTEIESVLGG